MPKSDAAAADTASLADRIAEAHEWLITLNDPASTAADRQNFEAWLSADPQRVDIYDRAQTLWSAFDETAHSDFDAKLFVPSFGERMRQLVDVMRRRPLRLVTSGALAAAACTALVVAVPYFKAQPDVSAPARAMRYQTALGETQTITLTDGSVVTLGASSGLDVRFSNDARQLSLTAGEAYFDVRRDTQRPFALTAGAMTVTVLGTRFDVRRSDKSVRVGVAEGVVDVSFPIMVDGQAMSMRTKQTLNIGQRVVADTQAGLKDVERVDVATIGAWRDQRLLYNGDTLAELVADANRYSNKRIAITDDSLADLRVRGAFRADDIDGMLAAIALLHPIDIEMPSADVVWLRAATSSKGAVP
ncbi:MAG: FecR domain-containing protein [Pseudomonadota bacterium]